MATDPSKYLLNHTMIRVKDPQATIKFYGFLGMKQIHKMQHKDSGFDLYFLAYDHDKSLSTGKFWADRQGVLELTHNYGTEDDSSFKVNNGNSDPGKGFGHVCVSVDNIQAACTRLEANGVKFQKKLTDGRMQNIAFALDPDGYWVEIVGQNDYKKTGDVKETDVETYKFNHSMYRIKDPKKSLKFYQDVLGMTLIEEAPVPAAKFTNYFLAYPQGDTDKEHREGILELCWNYGTENDPNFSYHNGNDKPDQGFGHICLAVDDIDAACARFDKMGVSWKKKLTDGKMRDIAFLLDPDGYWIEVMAKTGVEEPKSS